MLPAILIKHCWSFFHKSFLYSKNILCLHLPPILSSVQSAFHWRNSKIEFHFCLLAGSHWIPVWSLPAGTKSGKTSEEIWAASQYGMPDRWDSGQTPCPCGRTTSKLKTMAFLNLFLEENDHFFWFCFVFILSVINYNTLKSYSTWNFFGYLKVDAKFFGGTCSLMSHFFQNCPRKHIVFRLKVLLQDSPIENIPSGFMCLSSITRVI